MNVLNYRIIINLKNLLIDNANNHLIKINV